MTRLTFDTTDHSRHSTEWNAKALKTKSTSFEAYFMVPDMTWILQDRLLYPFVFSSYGWTNRVKFVLHSTA
jgi:hypothetical protein